MMTMRNRLSSAAKWWALLCISAFFGAQLHAQQLRVRKGDCLPQGLPGDTHHAQGPHRLPAINRQWDPERTYRQLVILVSYSDTDFQSDDPQARYNDMLNTPGYNERQGDGCLAEYFKVQSAGRFNVAFDVYGPYKVSTKAQPYANPTVNTHNYAVGPMTEATQLFLNDEQGGATLDFSPYDWNGDKRIEQVVYVMAGPTGNANLYGYVWPNTSSFAAITTPDGHIIANYSNSAEYWPLTNSSPSCGIGTIAHEYTHSLGLPDIYPTTSSAGYSVVDEWDLMDGGNFTNYGWCPPGYTPMERMLLGWLEPVELDSPTTITGMKTLSDGGDVYRIKHSASEWYLLENRQQEGWDLGLPGRGLVVYHVYYDKAVWSGNTVNNNASKRRFELVHADNLDYEQWVAMVEAMGLTSKYRNSGRMNNYYLSESAYPLFDADSIVINAELTDTSVPAATMNYPNEEGSTQLSKPITNIRMHDDGTISFDFMGGTSTAISETCNEQHAAGLYDLNGHKAVAGKHGLLIERRQDGTVRKIIR